MAWRSNPRHSRQKALIHALGLSFPAYNRLKRPWQLTGTIRNRFALCTVIFSLREVVLGIVVEFIPRNLQHKARKHKTPPFQAGCLWLSSYQSKTSAQNFSFSLPTGSAVSNSGTGWNLATCLSTQTDSQRLQPCLRNSGHLRTSCKTS